ncbi:x-ray repair cross-complementing protein [Anaeramoeba flamelloides]|uniref:X-ray repair cross-complementing protein n=1 Tax=Anaeramoeba flamelloides TaxID=1746091 RepID=A0ABQ8XK53_9EUKA|nr:x-ray repair cross-complementing protein [Anaeramoeba flamelloides]
MELYQFIVDVGTNATKKSLQETKEAMCVLVHKLILFKQKKSSVGIVLVGTEESKNPYAENYPNISQISTIKAPSFELISEIQNIQLEEDREETDIISSLLVASALLLDCENVMKTKKKNLNVKKTIYLFTNGETEISDPEELDVIAQDINKYNIEFIFILLSKTPVEGNQNTKSATRLKTEHNLDNFTTYLNDSIILKYKKAMKTILKFEDKTKLLRSTFKGDLEIGPVGIPIVIYTKASKENFPTMKKYSLLSKEFTLVKSERSYHLINDPTIEIDPNDRIQGYKYGNDILQFEDENELEKLKLKGLNRTFKVIGFTKKSNIIRHHLIGGCDLILPMSPESNKNALGSMAKAMHKMKVIGITRVVKRRNLKCPSLCYLAPYKDPNSKSWVLLSGKLPFVENLPQYTFNDFRAQKTLQPNKTQLKVIDQFIDKFALESTNENNKNFNLDIENGIFNPVTQLFYSEILKKLDPNLENIKIIQNNIKKIITSPIQKEEESMKSENNKNKLLKEKGIEIEIEKENYDDDDDNNNNNEKEDINAQIRQKIIEDLKLNFNLKKSQTFERKRNPESLFAISENTDLKIPKRKKKNENPNEDKQEKEPFQKFTFNDLVKVKKEENSDNDDDNLDNEQFNNDESGSESEDLSDDEDNDNESLFDLIQ